MNSSLTTVAPLYKIDNEEVDYKNECLSEDCAFVGYDEDLDTEDFSFYVEHSHGPEGFQMFEEIRRRGKLCDVTIKIGDLSLSAHRVVLSAVVPYFYDMFTNDMIESRQKDVTMSGLDQNVVEGLINFAYTGKVKITRENVQNMIFAASFLQLNKVLEACSEFVCCRLSKDNVLGFWLFGETLSIYSLVESSIKFIDDNYSEVCQSDEFFELNVSDLEKIIQSDKLYVPTEEVVFESVIEWVKKDLENRTEFLPRLLSNVRLPLLTPQYLLDKVATENLIRSSHECRDLLDEAKDYHLMPARRLLLQSFRTKPRFRKDNLGLIFAVGGLTKQGDAVRTVEYYDPILGQWQLSESMEMHRSRVGVVVIDQILYAIGGYDGTDRLATVEAFDRKTNLWSRVTSMNCKRSAVGAAVLYNCIYVCGGYNGLTSLNTVERYDIRSNKWDMIASMNKPRSAAGVVALDGHIYAVGGHNSVSIFDSAEKYDPATGQWTDVTPMLSKRCRLGCAELNGKLYVCGGYDGSTFLRTCEVFDPVTGRWAHVSSMNVIRSRVALVANLGKLFAIGGYDGVSNLSTVEVYDPDADKWSFITSMCAHEGGVGVGVIPYKNNLNEK